MVTLTQFKCVTTMVGARYHYCQEGIAHNKGSVGDFMKMDTMIVLVNTKWVKNEPC